MLSPLPFYRRWLARRWVRWSLYGLGALAVSLALLGWSQSIARQRVYAELGLPGKRVDIGGRALHWVEAGVEHRGDGPTVVLESGWSGGSLAWQHVLAGVGKQAYAIAYDRAGHGFSDDRAGPHNAVTVTEDLHALLTAIAAPPPYVLVGHSLGGAYVAAYFGRYKESVAGIVLVEVAPPEQMERARGMRFLMAPLRVLTLAMPGLATVGVTRVTGLLSRTATGLTGDWYTLAVEKLADPRHLSAARAEILGFPITMEASRNAGHMGDRPLRVIVAGGNPLTAQHPESQQRFLEFSDDSKLVFVPDANHFNVVVSPRYAPAVVDVILEVWAKTK